MRLVTYNIQYSSVKGECFDLPRVIDAVRGADVIALQEVERCWPRTGMVDPPDFIAKLLPEYYWVFAPFFDLDAGSDGDTQQADNRRRGWFRPSTVRGRHRSVRNHQRMMWEEC